MNHGGGIDRDQFLVSLRCHSRWRILLCAQDIFYVGLNHTHVPDEYSGRSSDSLMGIVT